MAAPNLSPFTIQPDLTGIAIAYRNTGMIADEVLPRVPVGKPSFKYTVYPKADAFTIPDTQVGRTSSPNEVEFGASEVTGSTKDYGLQLTIPEFDMLALEGGNSANSVYNPMRRGTMLLSDLIELDREVRVSNIVFNAANYGSANKTTLSGTSQWSDYTNSNPIDAILQAIDAMIAKPNVLTLGQATWTKLRQHPKVVNAVKGNYYGSGTVSREALADLLEIEKIVVGQAWVNSAKPGQTVTTARTWGKHASLLVVNPTVTPEGGLTFGYTPQWQNRLAYTKFDDERGARGSSVVKVVESVTELVVANDAGYFFQNAIA